MDEWTLLLNSAVQEIFLSMVDARESLLQAIKKAFSCVIPVLDAVQNWGGLEKSEDSEDVKENFRSSIKNFIGSFDGIILFFFAWSDSITYILLSLDWWRSVNQIM